MFACEITFRKIEATLSMLLNKLSLQDTPDKQSPEQSSSTKDDSPKIQLQQSVNKGTPSSVAHKQPATSIEQSQTGANATSGKIQSSTPQRADLTFEDENANLNKHSTS